MAKMYLQYHQMQSKSSTLLKKEGERLGTYRKKSTASTEGNKRIANGRMWRAVLYLPRETGVCDIKSAGEQ